MQPSTVQVEKTKKKKNSSQREHHDTEDTAGGGITRRWAGSTAKAYDEHTRRTVLSITATLSLKL